METERILVTVKTYPNLSQKYGEISCTAGFRENGSWIRLYPIRYRHLEPENRYKKYQWIKTSVTRNKSDIRPESFCVIDDSNIEIVGERIDTSNQWQKRKDIVFRNKKIYTNLREIISLAHCNEISLAIFKPTKVMDFKIDTTGDGEQYDRKLNSILKKLQQQNLFEGRNVAEFKYMPNINKRFRFVFEDDEGRKGTLMITDWEIGQLYLNSLKRYGEKKALEMVRKKFFDDLAQTKDLYFFLGTTYKSHVKKFTNPFIIVGTFYPPYPSPTVQRSISL